MDESIRNHACFKKLFEKFPGAWENSIDIPIFFNSNSGETYETHWAFRIQERKNRKKTTLLLLNYCPMCGEKLDPTLMAGMSVSEKLVRDKLDIARSALRGLKRDNPQGIYENEIWAIVTKALEETE